MSEQSEKTKYEYNTVLDNGIALRPGDRLVVRGYSGNVIERNVIYQYTYWFRNICYVAFTKQDGTIATVDAHRVGHARDAAIVRFCDKLADALDVLDNIADNYCGDLTADQAKRFHKAVAKLGKLAKEVS